MSNDAEAKPYLFRFYVTEESSYTEVIFSNIVKILDEKIPFLYELEVINILMKPKVAKADGVALTPALARIRPAPIEHYAGKLRTIEHIRQALSNLQLHPKPPG